MSIDSLGRVIVGSGHFADQTPRMMENVSRFMGDDRTVSNIEKASIHVEKSIGNLWSSAKKVDQFLGEKLYDIRFAEKPHSVHVEKEIGPPFGWLKKIDKSLGEKLYDIRFPTNIDQGSKIIPTAIMDKASQQQAAERMSQQAGENLQQLEEVGEDLLKAIGWGLSGNLGESAQNATSAGGKMAEIWWRGLPGPGMGGN